jgi:hypothetical protein
MSEFLKYPVATLGLLTLVILVFGTPIVLIVWPFWRRRALRQEATEYKEFIELDERVFAVQEQSGLIHIKARRRSLTWAAGIFLFLFGLSLLSLLIIPPSTSTSTTTTTSFPPFGAIAIFLAALSALFVSLSLPSITIDPQQQAILVTRRKRSHRINFQDVKKVYTEAQGSKTLFKVLLNDGQGFSLGSLTAHRKADEQRIQAFYNMLNETIKPPVKTSA